MSTPEKITSQFVLYVAEGEKPIKFTTKDIVFKATQENLDVVRVGGTDELPVVKLMDYAKFLYNQKKEKHRQEKAAKKVVTKEFKFLVTTHEHDIGIIANKILKAFSDGNKAKIVVSGKGRQAGFENLMYNQLDILEQKLGETFIVESPPKYEEGRSLVTYLIKK